MALRFFTGFDHLATGDLATRFRVAAGTVGAVGRNSSSGITAPIGLLVAIENASGTTFICGQACKFSAFPGYTLVRVMDGSTVHCSLQITAAGTLRVLDAAGATVGTSTWVASTGVFYYIEFKVIIDDIVGSAIVRVDGTNVLNLSNLDTRGPGAAASWNRFEYLAGSVDMDDLYVCDGSGSYCKDFLGDQRVEYLAAQTDAVAVGTNQGLTPSTGTDHGALVDDATPNGDTDYNSTAIAARKDTYHLPSMSSTGSVNGVQTQVYARKTDQIARTLQPVVRTGGTDYAQIARDVAAAYRYYTEILERNPRTDIPWINSEINSLEVGPAHGSVGLSVTRFYLHTTAAPYTPPTIRGAWDQTTGAIVKALDSRKAGGGDITFVQIAEVSAVADFDVLLGRWISGPLAAQTISGTINVCLAVAESAAAADIHYHLHLYVTTGDTDVPRGTIMTDYVEAAGVNEWGTTLAFKALNAAQTLTSLAISAGDRIVVEIGYISHEASATSRDGQLWYGTQNTTTGFEAADATVGSVLGNSTVGYIDFSVAIIESSSPAVRVSQVGVEVLSRNIPVVADPGGGGTVPAGTDPAAGVSLCGAVTPIVWITLQTDSGEKTYAKGDVAIDSTFKEARLLSISSIVRALSDRTGRIETANARIVLNDTDRVLRGLAATGTLLNKRVDVYVASAAQLRAGATPRRVAQLVVRDFQPEGDLLFSLQCEEYFGSVLGEYGTPRKIPAKLFTLADFPNCPSDLIGKAVPIAYGLQSDESKGSSAIGVLPAIPVGPRRLSDGLDWEEFVICGHAMKTIQSWFASDLRDVAIWNPASLGHGPRPIKMAPDTEGTEFLIPGFAGWTSVIGSARYREYNGNRYTVIFAKGQRATDARKGDVPISINGGGVEDVGDGTGTMIDSLPRQIEHFINQFVLQSYAGGNWLAMPSVNGYSRIFVSSFEAVKTASAVRISGGYLGAPYLGWNGEQNTVIDALKQLAQDCDCNLGINRHGQVMASMVDALAAPVKAFTDVTDVIKDSFAVRRRLELLANRVRLKFEKNYILDSRPDSARTGIPWYSDFSGITADTSDAASIAAINETRLLDLEGWSLRHSATATDVAAQLKTRNAFGPIYAKFQTDLCGLDVELGDTITLTHFAGMSGSGWTNKVLRVERITVDLDALTTELEGQAV